MVKDSLGIFLIRIRPPKLKSGLAVFFACLAVLIFGAVTARAASFTASLDRDTMTLGESATLSLTFEGGQSKNVPTPSVPGLQIVNTGNSQNFSIINGAMSSTVTVTFSVTARQPGEFTIPALKADVNGQQLSSQAAQTDRDHSQRAVRRRCQFRQRSRVSETGLSEVKNLRRRIRRGAA